jgi:predicted dehydrogenase
MAVAAGKHVYVEKPCSHNPREGELLVEFKNKYKKVIQMGNQQRSSFHTIEIINDIHNGVIGKPFRAVAFYSNGRGPVVNQVEQAPPAGLDWELFQGPSPRRKYTHDSWD